MRIHHGMPPCRRALTRAELIITLSNVMLIIAIICVTWRTGRSATAVIKDADQLRSIFAPLESFSKSDGGRYPRPGRIDRLPFAPSARGPKIDKPGHGPEDHAANTTAHLYSYMIGARMVTPDALISAAERNPAVTEKTDYDFTVINPRQDVYWDASFAADLQTGSNVSYAHIDLSGRVGENLWRSTHSSSQPLFGSRGPKDGVLNPASFTCDDNGDWRGSVLFGDGSVQTIRHLNVPSHRAIDLFDPQRGRSYLSFTRTVGPTGPVFQYD